MDSWIKIFRKFLQWEWFHKAEMVQLFVYLLLKANHEDKNWQGIVVRRGQLVTSIASISRDTRLSTQQVRTCLNRLKSTNEITIESTKHYSIVTICNYVDYQSLSNTDNKQINNHSDKQATNKQQTTNKQATITKEYKESRELENKEIKENIKKENKESQASFIDEYFAKTTFIESFCMQNHTTPEDMRTMAEAIIIEWDAAGVRHANYTEAHNHLTSTLRIRVRESKRNNMQVDNRPPRPSVHHIWSESQQKWVYSI